VEIQEFCLSWGYFKAFGPVGENRSGLQD